MHWAYPESKILMPKLKIEYLPQHNADYVTKKAPSPRLPQTVRGRGFLSGAFEKMIRWIVFDEEYETS